MPDVQTGRRIALVGMSASAILATLNIFVGLSAQSTSVVATGVELAGDVLASFDGLRRNDGSERASRRAASVRPRPHRNPCRVRRRAHSGCRWRGHLLELAPGHRRPIHPPPSSIAIFVLVFAIAVRGAMSFVKFRAGRRLRSASLVADAWNDAVDILAATVALTAVGLTMYDLERFRAADHYGGFAVGVIVILIGVRVLRDASLELMDTMPDETQIARIRAVAREVPGVVAVDKTYARKTGFATTWTFMSRSTRR